MNQGSVTIDHAFNDDVRLRNRTVYADYDKFYQNVYAGGAVDPATGLVPLAAYNNEQLRENFFNQTDLTFSAETGSVGHEFLVGMEIGEQTTDNLRMTGLFNGTDLAFLVPADDPMVSVPVTFAPTETDNTNHGRATIAAVYVQDQIQLTPNWLAVLGLRYDSFDMDFTDRRGAGVNIDTSDDLLSPRGGLIYKPAENVSLYASYSMTYVPRSGAQLASLALTNEAFDPEEFENIEVGAKWDVNPSLALTAALFQLDRKNVIIPDPANPTDPAASLLVDGQRTEGIELGISGHINESWSIQGGYAYQDGAPDGGPGRDAARAAAGARRLAVEPLRLQPGLRRRPRRDLPDGDVRGGRQPGRAARLHARRRRRLLHAERAAAHAAQRREPARRALLPERPQQQQHHAGIAAGCPGRR